MFKLLAVDVPTASSAEQRLYVEGDAKLYHRGGVINELRDPFIQVRTPCCGSAPRAALHTCVQTSHNEIHAITV